MLHDNTARNRRIGIALVSLCTLCFATLDACAKWLIHSLPVIEVVWLRFVAHVLWVALLLAPMQRGELLQVRSPRLQAIRGLMLALMTGVNFWALQYLQLAETAAIQFSVPLLIALYSAGKLGEHLDARRWLAIAIGFIGVLLVIRPGTGGFHPAIVLSVINALVYAAFNLLTRKMAATESPAATQLMSALMAAAVLAPFALLQWSTPASLTEWAVIAACGFCGALGHYGIALAHRYASAAVLSPFMYQQILYMTLWGWLLFAQVPDAFVVAGAVVVVSSGLWMLWMEMRRT